MGKFNSDDHYNYFYRQESLKRNGVALIVNKRVWNVACGCSLQNSRMILVRFQGRPFSITVIQVCAPITDASEAEVDQFSEDLLRTNSKKRCPFHHRGLECKNRKSRDTWSNRQVGPGSTKWGRVKANRVSRECTGHSKHLFQQPRRWLYMWISPDSQYWNQIDYVLCSQR